MDIRTLLFANAMVFAVLAIAMILVWRANPTFAGLPHLARVHAGMIVGSILIGLPTTVFPAVLSVFLGNGLVLLSMVWLLSGIRSLHGLARNRSPKIALPLWAAGLLFFFYVLPSLRGRILTTSAVTAAYILAAAWTARLGFLRPVERRSALLISGSLGLLSVVFLARIVYFSVAPQVSNPMGGDTFTRILMSTSLVAATGWTFGVMSLVYARVNEEARRSRTAVEQLVQVAAHELRNPLTSIVGTIGLLSAESLAFSQEERDRLLSMARRNSDRMIRLVNDLLDLERVESGLVAFELETLELEPLLRQAVELAESQASRCGVSLELAPVPAATVHADPQRLLQVLANLLSNAVKVSPRGETVRLAGWRTDGRVRVEVKDWGPGLPEEIRPRIFQRFVRGEADRQGTGLGLAISKAIVEGMRGRIGFETDAKTGTTFYFELPASAR
ncbi:MAG TPA: HAMP domain-containing sensor histidine kinase [Thermoanaerobaculia bacterium]|jgi:signal transduction histidine kinase|nr:HAMP domain-containing sensor histidine kinase [Thermoanaerobaculia bacterium]